MARAAGVLTLALIAAFGPLAAGAQSPQPAPSEDPAVTKVATSLVAQAQSGKVDRSLFDSQMNGALTADTLNSVKAQLAPLGPPKSLTFVGAGDTGSVHVVRYHVNWDATVLDEVIAFDSDGKIGGWFFRPATPAPAYVPPASTLTPLPTAPPKH